MPLSEARRRALEAIMGGTAAPAPRPRPPVSLAEALPVSEGVATTYPEPPPPENYDAVMERARRAGFGVDLLRAGGMVNEAITGARAPTEAFDDLAARAQQPVTDFKERERAALRAAPRPAGPAKPSASTDPTSEASKRYQEAFKAQYPDAPAPLIGAITEANYSEFRKVLGEDARIKSNATALASQEEREKTRLLQQQQEGQLNRSVQWARLRQEADESGKSREFRAWLFEKEEDAKEKERQAKQAEKQEALNVPGAAIAPGATPTVKDAETVKGVLTSEARMKNGIARMRQLHAKYGTEKGGKGAMQLSQAMTGLRLEAKNIAELGALSGPDQGLMESLAGDDPTDAWNNVKAFFGADNTEAALQGLEAWMDGQVRATLKLRGYEILPEPTAKHPDQVLPTGGRGNMTLAPPPAKRAAPAPTSAAGPEEMVKVVSPAGVPGSIPRKNLQKALAKGYREVK